jgi:hypothetical protein
MAVSTWLSVGASAQEFVNLGFDSPNLTGSLRPAEPGNPRTAFVGSTSQILQGWTLLGNGTSIGEIAYQPGDGNVLAPATLARRDNDGGENFRLVLFSGLPNPTEFRIRQTGMVPENAAGLALSAGGTVDMFVNDQLVYRTDINNTAFPIVNISQYSGQVVSLEFRVFRQQFSSGIFSFDIGGFTQIPEPSTWALFGVGAIVMGGVLQRRR